MAYATKYRIEFKDVENNDYVINIQPDGYTGAIIYLHPHAEPLILNFPETDKFNPVEGTGVTIKFYSGGNNLDDLFTINPLQTRVYITYNGNDFFIGWLNTESYEEDYSTDNSTISILANDGLGSLSRILFFDDVTFPYRKGRATWGEIVAQCMSSISETFTRYMLITRLINENFSTANSVYIPNELEFDLSAFIDEDNISLSKRQVLERLMRCLGLTLKISQGYCWIFSRSYLTASIVSVKAFNKTFEFIANYSIDNKLDIADNEFKMINRQQRRIFKPGLREIKIDYCPYPDPRKIAPFENLTVDNYTSSSWSTKTDTYVYKTFETDENTEGLAKYKGNDSTNYAGEIFKYSGNKEDNVDDANVYIGKIDVTTDTTKKLFKIEGGYIPYGSFDLGLQFDALFNTDQDIVVAHAKIKIMAKIGNKYGVLTSSAITNYASLYFNSDTEQIDYLWISNIAGSTPIDMRNNQITVKINLRTDLNNAVGNFEITFYADIKLYDASSNEITPTGETILGFKNFKTLGNRSPLDFSSVIDSGKGDTSYTSQDLIKIEHSDIRIEGKADRGLITCNGSPTNINTSTRWQLDTIDTTQYYSLPQILLRYYLSEYEDKYEEINALIRTNYMFVKNGDLFSKTLSAITVIMDTDHLGQKQFAFMSGDYDCRKRLLEGVFQEIKGITQDIL